MTRAVRLRGYTFTPYADTYWSQVGCAAFDMLSPEQQDEVNNSPDGVTEELELLVKDLFKEINQILERKVND